MHPAGSPVVDSSGPDVTAMPSAMPRSSSPPSAPRTCTLRTRFVAFPDLERAVALLVREDGRVFAPLDPDQVARGETLKVVFTTEDGAVSLNRLAVVDSITPDATISFGHRGVVLRLLDWKSPLVQVTGEIEAFEERRNPLAGVDTNMVALLIECSLTESNLEVGRSYDDIPVVDLPQLDADDVDESEPTRPVAARVLPPLTIEWSNGVSEVFEDPGGPEPAPLPPRGRSVVRSLLAGSGLGLAVAAALVLGPTWTRLIFGTPLPAVMKTLSGSISLDGREPLPPGLLLAAGFIPPLIPAAAPEPAAAEPAEEPGAPRGEPSSCLMRLSSRPSHVEIWAEGRRIGRTPSDRLAVPCGAELVFKRPRYQSTAVRAPGQPGGPVEALSVNLLRPTAQLVVSSEPEGAEVRLHGRTVGQTPATITISRFESLSVEVRAPHFRSWKKHLYVRTAEMAVRADLVARAGGSRRRGGSSPHQRVSRPVASSPAAPGR
jgi:hypothetical protein